MLTIILYIIILIALFFIAVMIWDCNHFVVRSYDVASEKVKRPCRYALLADLHNKSFGGENRKLIEAIEQMHPDGILIAGDMMTASPGHNAETARHLVKVLSEKYPVYYGVGNHEYRSKLDTDVYGDLGVAYERALISMGGVALLDNCRTTTPEGIDICGLTIDREYYKKFWHISMKPSYIDQTVGKAKVDAFQILIAHNPQYFETYADWGADLTVSGHVHGGLMRLPLLGGVISPSLRIFPKYDGGRFERNGKTLIVSRGLGSHTLPIRIFNPGELILIDIHP